MSLFRRQTYVAAGYRVFLLVFFCAAGISLAGYKSAYAFWPQQKKENVSPVSAEDKNNELKPLSQDYQELKDTYDKLQKDFQAVSMDRDNLINQAKLLLQDRGRVKELEEALAKAESEQDLVLKEKEEAISKIQELQDKNTELENTQGRLLNERKQIENSLAKERDKSGIKKLQDEKFTLQKENSELKAALKERRAALEKIKNDKVKADKILAKMDAELAQGRQRLETLNTNYQEALKKNKLMEERAVEAPQKFAELAHQNKTLIKQTGNMHYNLGVFYTKNKEYSRAVAEFEEAVKLRPEDAYSHFNLGYIYAEFIINRPKAIEHFRHYLRLAKKDDKDLDWVKKYILTWQAWGGREPME